MVTKEERARLRALAEAATRESWAVRTQSRGEHEIGPPHENAAHSWHEGNAHFIAAARTAVPALLDALDAAEARSDQYQSIARDFLESLPKCEHGGCHRPATRGYISHEPHYCETHRDDGYSFHEADWADSVHHAEAALAADLADVEPKEGTNG